MPEGPADRRTHLRENDLMLDLNTYLVKQQAGLFKRMAAYDIFDPNSNQQIGVAKEERPRSSTFCDCL
jgi:hypothetical protein